MAALTDTHHALGNFQFTASDEKISCQVSGDQLVISSAVPVTEPVQITASKTNTTRVGMVVWTDGTYDSSQNSRQDMVSYGQQIKDPVSAFLYVKTSYGGLTLQKTAEDGKVANISFTVTGENFNQVVQTDSTGNLQIDQLLPGIYTVTEQTSSLYQPQEAHRVTVVSGETASVTFNNTLKRGHLQVTKTAEDGLTEGIRFHLSGTSDSGLAVDAYALTNAAGVAAFSDVLMGSGYVLEEMDTPERYVVPDAQTTFVKWNEVTNCTVANVLKKFAVTVTKSDAAAGIAQGDGTLAGAVYGLYKGGALMEQYTTDENGQFTTPPYVCGNDWTIREITPSEGYLLNAAVYHVGAEARLYTVEQNHTALDVAEHALMGSIALIKHTDDGSTQIETPEAGTVFAIYRSAAGSFAEAKETERDMLTCDENGFAQSRNLPYGQYTVHQVSGWDGREKIEDFTVYISRNDAVYRYLINNANFTSYLKVEKEDVETGKTIACAGAGFQIFYPDGSPVTMHMTYPTPADINTFYTNEAGYLMTPEKLLYGKGYTLVEVQAPYGYTLNDTPISFDMTPDDSGQEDGLTVIAVQQADLAQKGIIHIAKKGEVFSSVQKTDQFYQPVYETQGLAGASYEVTAAENIYTPDGTLRAAKGTVVDTVTTGADGMAETDTLYLGQYTVREITAPAGMVLDDTIQEVTLTYQAPHYHSGSAAHYRENDTCYHAYRDAPAGQDVAGI